MPVNKYSIGCACCQTGGSDPTDPYCLAPGATNQHFDFPDGEQPFTPAYGTWDNIEIIGGRLVSSGSNVLLPLANGGENDVGTIIPGRYQIMGSGRLAIGGSGEETGFEAFLYFDVAGAGSLSFGDYNISDPGVYTSLGSLSVDPPLPTGFCIFDIETQGSSGIKITLHGAEECNVWVSGGLGTLGGAMGVQADVSSPALSPECDFTDIIVSGLSTDPSDPCVCPDIVSCEEHPCDGSTSRLGIQLDVTFPDPVVTRDWETWECPIYSSFGHYEMRQVIYGMSAGNCTLTIEDPDGWGGSRCTPWQGCVRHDFSYTLVTEYRNVECDEFYPQQDEIYNGTVFLCNSGWDIRFAWEPEGYPELWDYTYLGCCSSFTTEPKLYEVGCPGFGAGIVSGALGYGEYWMGYGQRSYCFNTDIGDKCGGYEGITFNITYLYL